MAMWDMFAMKTREQKEKEQQEFETKVFPLGMAQRDAASAVLKEVCVASVRARDTERLFAYLSAKDKYYNEEDPAAAMQAAFISLKKQNWLKGDDGKQIVALILMEHGIKELSEYPSAEDVRERAKELP